MGRLLIILLIIALILIILYLMRERTRTSERQRLEAGRRLEPGARASERASALPEEASTGRGGQFQGAADRAAGLGFERATDQMEAMTADLAEARREADLAAAHLSSQASDALAAVQAAAATHGGAVPGDGTSVCPSGYPVKGRMTSLLYYEQGAPDHAEMIADVCFQSMEAAEAAGFLSAIRADAVVAEEVAVIQDEATGDAEAIVADAVLIRERESGERADIVAEAIEAADAGGVPPGAIRGDGGKDCPPAYPIKGNQSSMLYHEPGTPTYESTIPEFCFSSVDSATAAGFRATSY